MADRRMVKWLALVAGGMVIGTAVFIRQFRQSPIKNSYYVALGSSFAAGLGLGDREPGSPIISQRSVNGYPQQLARLLQVPSFTDMTSSGSTVAQVLRGGQLWLGPQIDALGPDTRLVTLTAGGNDVGYVGDLTAMAFSNRGAILRTVVGMFWKGAKPADEREFDKLQADLTATLHEIRRRSPRAHIAVVTYPAIVPDEGSCPDLGITESQASLMRLVAENLAQVTREAAERTGATAVDMAVLSANHDACSAEPWVNGFRPKTGTSFHPTIAGARATAQAVADAVKLRAD